MKIRTYYWHDRVLSRPGFFLNRLVGKDLSRSFLHGNAGDIFAKTLIEHVYSCESMNCRVGGNRLLLIGSIGHNAQSGDVLCGAGVKYTDMPKAADLQLNIWALRGPISYEVFKKAGHDVSQVKFLLDPGLMLRFLVEDHCMPEGVGFIPHYRERGSYRGRLPKHVKFIDIDNHPLKVAREILSVETVYASSLHGIIFAHALQRPAVLVQPLTEEPLLKYQDYFASINTQFPRPMIDVGDFRFRNHPISPADIKYSREDFVFPDVEYLTKLGVMEASRKAH